MSMNALGGMAMSAASNAKWPLFALSQLNNISYMVRDGVRGETVIPKERYIDYGVRGYLGTFIMAYTYELAFRMVESWYTARNIAKAIGLDRLSTWYSKKGIQESLNIGSINHIKTVTENITGPLASEKTYSAFADTWAKALMGENIDLNHLSEAEKKQLNDQLPKALEYLRKIRFYDYRGGDYINHVLKKSDSADWLAKKLNAYYGAEGVQILGKQQLEPAVRLLREIMGEAELTKNIMDSVLAEPSQKISLVPKFLRSKKEVVSKTLAELRKMDSGALKAVTLTVDQKLEVLKHLKLSDDIHSWKKIQDPLVNQVLKSVLGPYNIPLPNSDDVVLKAMSEEDSRMVYRAILSAKKALSKFTDAGALKKAKNAFDVDYRAELKTLQHLASESANHQVAPKGISQATYFLKKAHLEKMKGSNTYSALLKKLMSEEMTWVEHITKKMHAPWVNHEKGRQKLTKIMQSGVYQKIEAFMVDGKKAFKNKAQREAAYKWLNHYVGEGFKSWHVQREVKKAKLTEFWPKMLISLGLNVIAHGFFLSIADVQWAQKLEKKLVAEGISPDKVFRGPMYTGAIPGMALYLAMMSDKVMNVVPLLGKQVKKMGRVSRHAVAGALGLTAYGLWTVSGTYRNIKKERLKSAHAHKYQPVVPAHYRESALQPISFNQFAHSTMFDGSIHAFNSSPVQKKATNPFQFQPQ